MNEYNIYINKIMRHYTYSPELIRDDAGFNKNYKNLRQTAKTQVIDRGGES